jgi:hypothetical protein
MHGSRSTVATTTSVAQHYNTVDCTHFLCDATSASARCCRSGGVGFVPSLASRRVYPVITTAPHDSSDRKCLGLQRHMRSLGLQRHTIGLQRHIIGLHWRVKLGLQCEAERHSATPLPDPRLGDGRVIKLHRKPAHLRSWRLLRPMNELFSSLLNSTRNAKFGRQQSLAEVVRVRPQSQPTPSPILGLQQTTDHMWNEATCSWPLLASCGTVSMETDTKLRARKSR